MDEIDWKKAEKLAMNKFRWMILCLSTMVKIHIVVCRFPVR